MIFIREKELQRLRETYKPGDRVELVCMNDIQAPPIGTKGTVKHVDDAGTIHISWETGSSLGIVYGEDLCRKIENGGK